MPRKYVRKGGSHPRGLWTEDALKSAFEELRQNKYSINEISRRYGIPSRTIRRRFAKQDTKKLTLGKHPVLDFDNEKRLVAHVQKLEAAGFPVTPDMIRSLAFEFAENLGIKHNFYKETRKAGPHWLQSFLERNPELNVRLTEARAHGLNHEELNKTFELVLHVLRQHDFLDKPDHMFDIPDKPGEVIATRGVKLVHSVTSREKGFSIIACCNAAGNFLPPTVIIEGTNKMPEFHDEVPLRSDEYMSKDSDYVNAELFQKWLVQHFVPLKPLGKVVPILDEHPSHTNSVEMLETPEENNVILFCLPSHSTQALQPLDLSFFKRFKAFYSAETKNWMLGTKEVHNDQDNVSFDEVSASRLPGPSRRYQTLPNLDYGEVGISSTFNKTRGSSPPNPDQTCETSGGHKSPSLLTHQPSAEMKETPSKDLQECCPILKSPVPLYKRGKQSASILTSKENIAKEYKDKATPNIPCKSNKQSKN